MSLFVCIIIRPIGFTAIFFSVNGYQYAEATKVAWLEFLTIIIQYIYQIYLFDDSQDILEIIGVILIVIGSTTSMIQELYNYCYKYNTHNKEYQPIRDMDSNDHLLDEHISYVMIYLNRHNCKLLNSQYLLELKLSN